MTRRHAEHSEPRKKHRITKRHVATHAAAALITAAAMYGAGPHAGTGTAPVMPAPAGMQPYCDASLWQHVYHPDRFTILDSCHGMTGVVQSIRYESDGDAHIQVRPDAPYASMLNGANQQLQNGALVVEPVCVRMPTQADAIMACANYQNTVWIPPIGAHVQAVGPWVTDNQHGWNEEHPITSIGNATS